MRSIEPAERPTLWFKHVLLPHVPWQFYPSGRHYRRHAPEPIPGLNGPDGFGDPWLVKVSYQRHLLQLGLADRLLGELLGTPAPARPLPRRARRRRGRPRHRVPTWASSAVRSRGANVEDLAPVPLLVKLPRQRRGRIDRPHVETIDVLPTILELARVRTNREMDGRSLLHPVCRAGATASGLPPRRDQLNTIGGEYSFDPADLARRRQAAVRRKLALVREREATPSGSTGSARTRSSWACERPLSRG